MEIIILIIVGLFALSISLSLLMLLIGGAVNLFFWASEQGFVGVAAYFACWVFLLPLMIIGCIIIGAVDYWHDRQEQ